MLTNCLVTSLFVKPTDQATHEQQTSKQTVVRRSGLMTLSDPTYLYVYNVVTHSRIEEVK